PARGPAAARTSSWSTLTAPRFRAFSPTTHRLRAVSTSPSTITWTTLCRPSSLVRARVAAAQFDCSAATMPLWSTSSSAPARPHLAAAVECEHRVVGAEGRPEGAEIDGIDAAVAVGIAEEAEELVRRVTDQHEVVAAYAVAIAVERAARAGHQVGENGERVPA